MILIPPSIDPGIAFVVYSQGIANQNDFAVEIAEVVMNVS